MLTFAILACACAVYFAGTFEFFLRLGGENGKTPLVRVIENLAGLLPVIACGVIEYRKLVQSGEAGSRLWLSVTGMALGAPIAGVVLFLIVSFALFSKSTR